MKGYFRKRDNGKWSFTVDIGKDPITGKRRQKNRSGFKTKKEAQAVCAELINEIERGEYRTIENVLIVDFFNDFIKSQVEPNFRTSTISGYKKTLNVVVKKHWAKVNINDITPMHIQQLYTDLGENYKPGTIKNVHTHLKRVFDTAYQWGVIKTNPAVVKPPSTKRSNSSKNFWSVEECMEFLSKTEGDIYHVVYELAIFTGLRRGEILGLPYSQVDFEKNLIHVKQQLVCVDGKAYLTDELKSRDAYRTVPIPEQIMKKLKDYIHSQRKKMMELGVTNKHNLVFATSKGNWIHPNALNKMFRALILKHDLKRIPFHGLRHSHATMLAEMKENVHAISSRLGHSSTTITNEMYIHLTDKMTQELSDNLSAMYDKQFKM